MWEQFGGGETWTDTFRVELTELCAHKVCRFYYCYSCSSLEQSPAARWSANPSGAAGYFAETWPCCGGLRRRVKLCSGGALSRGSGRTVAALFCRVAVFALHEQRTGWSSRLGTERRWRSRRAVYNNNTTAATSADWQHAAANGGAALPSATRYIWKVVTSSR